MEKAMTAQLPQALAQYFAAKNSYDIDGMVAQFDDDASVRDEGQEYRGRAAIRAWIEHATRKYRVTVEVKDVARDGGRDIVSGVVSGDFPGSPAALRYAFTLAGTKITRLEIV
jgi:ketosteroid isomerase-like protein